MNKLNEDYVPEYEALAELAVRTNALLLVYTPKSQQLDPLISSIRQSAEASGLPAELWTELVLMLERREPFAAVKQRVLAVPHQSWRLSGRRRVVQSRPILTSPIFRT